MSRLLLEVVIAAMLLSSLYERRGSSPGPLRAPGWMNLLVAFTFLKESWALATYCVSGVLLRAAMEAFLILLIIVVLRMGTVKVIVVTLAAEKEGICAWVERRHLAV